MSFLPLFDNVLHDLQSVCNSPLQLDPDSTLYTIHKKQFDQCFEKKESEKTRRRTSGEEILTFRIFVSIISLLSQMDSVYV